MKIPFSSVSNSIARPPANSGVSQTLAPIWGLPAGSATTPVSLPKLGAAKDELQMSEELRRTKAAHRNNFTNHLAGEVCAAIFSLGGGVTVKSSDRVIV